MSKPIPVQNLEGDGSSLWGNSRGIFSVTEVEVDYVNWVSYPKNAKTDDIHASVTLSGPTTRGEHYTDSAIEKAASRNAVILAAVRELVETKLAEAGIKHRVPAFHLRWSEWGMQPDNGWNFDLGSAVKREAAKYPLSKTNG